LDGKEEYMANDTALLVIDMQVGNVTNVYRKDEIVARLEELIAAARAAASPPERCRALRAVARVPVARRMH